MSRCLRCRRLFKEALFGELSGESARFFSSHLERCSECRAAYSQMEATVQVVDKSSRRQPDPEFWDGYWERLQARMEKDGIIPGRMNPDRRPSRRPAVFFPRWARQAAAGAALVLVGILIGRVIFAPPASTAPPVDAPSSVVRIEPGFELVNRAQAYVRRSRMMLTAIVNFDPDTEDPYALDLDYRQRMSRDLVEEAAWLKQGLADSGTYRLRELVADLEVILLQIANLDSPGLVDIDMIRAGIESRGILFKIYLVETDPKLLRPRDPSRGDAAEKKL